MDKGLALLGFLKAAATLRRKRVSSYGTGDKLVWFADIPKDRPECRSPFLTDKPGELGDLWIEVRKKRMPTRSALPEAIADWVRADDLDQPDKEPELLAEITVLVKRQVPDPDAPPESHETVVEKRPQLLRLSEHRQVEDGWLEYLVNKWEPWAKEMLRWQEVQRVYEDLDFMRRRLEESEERYELLLAVGLLQWRDSTGTSVKRHLLTAPAEISLDAARGILTVVPAASFDRFRVELDMLELQDQPRLNGVAIEDQLDELDARAWDTARLAQILREIANRLRSDAQVDEAAFRPADRSEESPRLSYAPALVLRERRPTSYEDLVRKFLEIASGTRLEDTKPWRRLLLEGETPGGASDGSGFGPSGNEPGALQLDRYLFPLPANDEQRQIVHRLQIEPCVLVKGPPGTGKSHTIANLICHLLASGDRVLVTAHAPKALAVLRGLLPDDVHDLCVTTLGSAREDQRLLEESVRGILRRKNYWRGAEWAQQTIDQTEKRLQQIEGELATVERRLRECREAETHSHTLPGGYQGTAAQIARRLHQESELFGWFPDGGSDNVSLALEPVDVAFLVEVHGQLSKEKLEELRFEIGDLDLPDPDEFGRFVDALLTAEDSAGSATNAAAAEKLEALRNRSLEALKRLQAALAAMEEHAVRAVRVLGDLTEEILADLLVGNVDRWARLASAAVALLNTADTLRKRLGTTRIEMPADAHRDRLRTDAERRRDHFEQGGHRGFSVLAPRVVRETRYVEERCLVDGQEPRKPELLAKVVDFLQLEQTTREFSPLWPAHLPAWVMPLHKLWDTVDAQPGMFDTVIVDEASQAGIDSLALLLLAKRIVVVGDDKQNSPEAVGVLEDDIARLAREHLNQFRFRDEFRPDTSLFDHAERAFGSLISLREHFRCVPEIIRFSNDLCYRDAPLVPLRQAPPNRLSPVRSKFIAEGVCEGEGQRIRNRAEAEALVEVIQSLVEDDACEGKTIGVIALQGHAQAELIENLLAQRLDPKTIEERRLRCGEPATFQGDERDIILLSLVIAPNVQYRALSRLPDQRRFNVAMSRARDQVWLFHSVRQHDLSPEDLRRKLLNFFERPGHGALDRLSENLDHLEREARRPRRRGNQPEPYESWFEVDVALELLRRKYAVRPQVEIAGKRIDLVVDGIVGRLAVECDGDEWHGAEDYERDMARQRQLERSGWTFARVRESDFYVDRAGATSTMTDACEALGVYPFDRTGETGGQSSVQDPDGQIVAGTSGAESITESRPRGEEETTDADVSTAAYGPFSRYSETSGFPDPRDTSPANVRAVLRQIIETDGPLTRSSVYRLYVEGCPSLQRVGKVVRQALSRALGAMLRAGEIDQEDELSDASPEGQVVRLAGAGKVEMRPAGRRDLLEIPPSELLAVLGRLFPANPGAREDDETLLRSVLEHYGFSRLTRPRRDYLAKVLRLRNTKEKELGTTHGTGSEAV